MAEVQSRGATRGRGGFRPGRGGFRGARNPSRSHNKQDQDQQENVPPALEDQGEVGELKIKFGDKVPLLKEICPGWSDEDLVYALQETDGDINAAVDRISTGTISQWGEVKKKQPKAKESTSTSAESATTRSRGRGNLEGRGRGRGGTERSARGARSTKNATSTHTNGTKSAAVADEGAAAGTTTATADAPSTSVNGDAAAAGDWANDPGKDSLSSLQTDEPKPASSAVPATAKTGGWAGLFAKPNPPPPPPPVAAVAAAAATAAAPPKKAPIAVPTPPSGPEPAVEEPAPPADEIAPVESLAPPPIEDQLSDEGASELPSAPHSDTGKDLAPPKDELTEKNLEKLPDTSHPIASATAASTVASTLDPLAAHEAAKPIPRPGMSGYAATALKATGGTVRSASFARKVMEQQEAVVMPGHHAVEKAAVQFGKLGLNGDDLDIDEEREEPETRTQLPDDSPSAPRASLPPSMPEAQQQPAIPTQPAADAQSAPRPAPGLPPAPQQAQQPPQAPAQAQQPQQPQQQPQPPQQQEPSPQSANAYADQYRYGQGQKPYDPFGQQSQPQSQPQSQEPFSNQVPNQPATSQPDYASYYGREAYQHYGYGYGQAQERTGSAFGTSAPDSQAQYATARPGQPQALGQQESTGSGNNTPAPTMPSHHAQQHSGHMGQTQHAYPYGYPNYGQQYPQYGTSYMNQMNHRYGANRPMFDDVRRQDSDYYGSQYNYGHNYGSGAYKSNMYGQPGQQYSYDQHSSSPANASSFGREGGYGGRTSSTQPSEAPQSQSTSTAFGGVPDPFGRSSSGFGQQQHATSDDPAKPSGPSPSMQGGRPGSAVNSLPGQQSALPPPAQQSGHQAFGGYPQYGGGFGNTSGHQQSTHQNTGYGYGSNSFGNYGAYGGGRGWNGSYGSGH